MNEALARVRWTIGQILLPDHFRTLEGAMSAESYAHARGAGLPAYGLTRLDWNAASPKNGQVEISAVQWIRETGDVLDVPENARLTQPLNLEKVGRPEVDVYLHALDPELPDDAAVTQPSGGQDVPRAWRSLVLSAESTLQGSAGYLKLARMEKPVGGTWQLSQLYVPPLLRIGPTEFLVDALRTLRLDLDAFEGTLLGRLLDAETANEARWAAQRCRIEARKLGAALEDVLRGGVELHPYVLFSTLRAFLMELDLLEGASAISDLVHYDHDDLGTCFGTVLGGITSRIRAEPPVTPVLRFDREQLSSGDAWLVLRDIPSEVLDADQLYVLIQKPSATVEVSLKTAPIGAPARLREIIRRALEPVQVYRQIDSPVTRMFGPWIDVYFIDREGSGVEWQYVRQERGIALLARGVDEAAKVHLFWITESGAKTAVVEKR